MKVLKRNGKIETFNVSKVLDAVKKAYKAKDGRSYLYGSFNLGGTVSGRLSSSKP